MWTNISGLLLRSLTSGWGVLVLALLAGGAWTLWISKQADELLDDLTAEELAHNLTRAELAKACLKISTLGALLERERQAASALRGSLADALERETQAASAAYARKKILDAVRTVPRQKSEEVVDDATRHAVCDRLNRPL